MSKDIDTPLVQEFLEASGFIARRIPETDKKGERTPDLLVEDGTERYLIEVKGKDVDQAFEDLLNSPLGTSLSLHKNNSISKKIKDADEQLELYSQRKENDFRLLWFPVFRTLNEQIVFDKVRSVIYGLLSLEGYTKEKEYFSKECYFFTYNDFYRYK